MEYILLWGCNTTVAEIGITEYAMKVDAVILRLWERDCASSGLTSYEKLGNDSCRVTTFCAWLKWFRQRLPELVQLRNKSNGENINISETRRFLIIWDYF